MADMTSTNRGLVMKMKIFLTGFNKKPVILDVTEYKLKKNFLCVRLIGGKCISYNVNHIESFEVEPWT